MSEEPTAPAVADGRATRWTGQQQLRQAQFVDAALLAIAEHGPDTSTEQIAAQAGVARTRLYRHFSDASELNQAIAARVEVMMLEALAPAWDPSTSPATIIRTAVSTHLRWLTTHPQLYRYLVRHAVSTPTGGNVVNDVKQLISDLLVRLLEGYVEPLGLDRALLQPMAFGLVGFVDAAAGRWVDDPQGLRPDQMVDMLSDWIWSVLDGVLRDRGLTVDPDQPVDLTSVVVS